MPESALELSKQIKSMSKRIANSEDEITTKAKENIFPIILGCHKGKAERELKEIRNKLKKFYPHTCLLKDIPDIKEIDYNAKFKHYIKDLRLGGGYVFPIIYLHPSLNKGGGVGLINEIRDITDHIDHPVLLKSIVLQRQKAKPFEHVKYIPHRKNINNLNECSEKALNHLNNNLRWIRNRMLLKVPQNIFKDKKNTSRRGKKDG